VQNGTACKNTYTVGIIALIQAS